MSVSVLTFGEGMLRLSVPVGERLERAASLDVHPAGSEANVAAALAQLGVSVAWYSILPDNALGRRLFAELAACGVDLSLVSWVEGRMGVFFVEVSAPPRPVSILYDRAGSTATTMSLESFPWDAMAKADVVHVSGITPATSSACRDLTIELADRVQGTQTRLSLDVNYRSKLWTVDEARVTFDAMAGRVDLLIVNREDARDVFGITGDGPAVAERVQEALGARDVVLSLGEDGAVWRSDGSSHEQKPREATVVDRIGAGDAFAAGVLAGYLDGDLGRGVEMGTTMAALALGVIGDFLTTSLDEVSRLMDGGGRSVDR